MFKKKKKILKIQSFLKNQPGLPAHIGIIMDGNGRWAKKRGLPRIAGHNAGIETVRHMVEICAELGIKVLTLYTFSQDNWKRPRWEVSALMKLLVNTINKEIDELIEKNVKIICIGKLENLPEPTKNSMYNAIDLTKKNTGLILNLALSYGSRDEIRDAIIKITHEVKNGEIQPSQINDQLIRSHLQTADLPDPDLIIRTSGEFRISNFLLWQIAYSEIYVTKTLWPDFRKSDLFKALQNYLSRERRFGKTTEQIKFHSQ
jgi:undecaprenyl diphosphate synthase